MADIFADLLEPVGGLLTADTTSFTADASYPTADTVSLAGAADTLDAEVIAAEVVEPGGGFLLPRPRPIVGVGYGVLPELEGKGFGHIGLLGEGVGTLGRLAGAAEGTIGVTGDAAGRLAIRAAGEGQRIVAAKAIAALDELAGEAAGSGVARGDGMGAIGKLTGAAVGQHDDDEATVMAFLLAA